MQVQFPSQPNDTKGISKGGAWIFIYFDFMHIERGVVSQGDGSKQKAVHLIIQDLFYVIRIMCT